MNDGRVQQGEVLVSEGKLDEAETCFQAVLDDNPGNAQALSNLGVVATARDNFRLAELFFRKAIAADESHIPSLMKLAEIYGARKAWGKAIPCLQRCREISPSHLDFHNELASAYLEAGDQLRASLAIKQSLNLEPNQPEMRGTLELVEGHLSSYSVIRTPLSSFLLSNRDQVMRRVLTRGVPVGSERMDRAVSMTRKLVAPQWRPRSFVDVGANIGTHSIYAFKTHGFEQGMAIEMAEDNFRILRCNLILADIDGAVTAVNCGLSSVGGTHTMELSPYNPGDHRLRPGSSRVPDLHGEEGWETKSCELRTFDGTVSPELLSSKGSLVWINTKGHEAHVLSGAKSLFDSHTPFVMDFWPYGIERQGSNCEAIAELLASCAVYDLRHDSGRLDADRLASLYQRHRGEEKKGHPSHTELLILP